MALHTRVHESLRKETTDLERWRRTDREPEINRSTMQRRTTIVIAGFINNLWNTDPDLLLELVQDILEKFEFRNQINRLSTRAEW